MHLQVMVLQLWLVIFLHMTLRLCAKPYEGDATITPISLWP